MTDRIEAAKSSRAACRKCGEKIKKGELRFGEEYESEYGVAFRWYHLPCAAQKLPALVQKTLARFDGEVPEREALDAILAGGGGDGAGAEAKEILPDYPDVSIAPTGRASCIQCGDTIAKGTQRIAVEIDMEINGRPTRGAGYMHPACVGAWLGDNEDVDAAAFNKIVVAKGGELAQAKVRPVVELPPIADKSTKQLHAIAKKITKLRDVYRIGDYLEEQVEWKHKDEVLLHLLEHGALDAGRNVYVAVYLGRIVEQGAFEGEELARLLRVTLRVLRELPAKLKYAETPLLPELPAAVFQLAAFSWAHAPERARAVYADAKPNVKVGLALAMALARAELPAGGAELLTEALGALVGDYPPTVYSPYLAEEELELDVDALALQLGTTAIVEQRGLALLKKRSPELQTLHGLRTAFAKATPKQVMRGIDAFLCYASKPEGWGPLREALAPREDLVKLAKLAAKVDESSGERVRLLLLGLLEELPKRIEDSLWFSELTSYDGAFISEYESVMTKLGQARALALGERALVHETPIEARKAWLPLLVRVFGESALPLLHAAIARGHTRCLQLAPEHALVAINAVGDELEDGVTPRVSIAVALAAAAKPVPAELDVLIAERPRTINRFVGALPDARLITIVEAAMQANPPETVIGQVRGASEEVRRAAIGTFVARRKKIKKTTDARYALQSFPDAAKLLEAQLADVDPGEKKFFRMLEKALAKDDYARVCAAVGRKVETPLEKLERLMAGEGTKRTTLFFPAEGELASLRVETLSYVGGAAPPGVEVPKGQEDDTTHILSLDLSPFADLVAEFGAETLSLFVEAPNSGEFNDDAVLVASPKLEAIPKGGRALDVGALQLPEALRRAGKSEEARDLRSILYARDGHAFGPAYWIQRDHGPSVTLQLNDAHLNLGDAGSLYMGGFGTTWQSH